jgi:hypothetical protein
LNVTILSLFRNSTHYLERYFEQMDSLQARLRERGDTLHLILGYGDSIDGTGEALFDECANRFCALLVDVSHGGRHYGSIEHPTRFKQLAYCGNKLLACVPTDADVVGIVESDLIWDANTMVALIDHLAHVPAIAPMIMDGERSFYDGYAFRKNGVRFTKTPPYCEWLGSDLMQVDSAGSVLFARGNLARKARLTDEQVIVGYCEAIREQGGSIWLDPTRTVYHPPYFPGDGRGSHPERDSQRVRV